MGITTVALIDTDCDPDLVDLPIPGNDDGIRSIELVLRSLADAVMAGKATATVEAKKEEPPSDTPAPEAKAEDSAEPAPATESEASS